MFCKNCGHQVPDDARFCIYCGQKIDNDFIANNTNSSMPKEKVVFVEDPTDVVLEEPVENKFKTKITACKNKITENNSKGNFNKDKIISIVKKSVCLLIALLVFISCFTPIVSFKVEEFPGFEEIEDLDKDFAKKSIGYSPVELIQLTFDSFKSYETALDDPLSDKMEDMSEDIVDIDYERMSNKDMGVLTKYLKLTTRLMMRVETYPTRVGIILAGAFSLLLIIYSVVLFTAMLLSLLIELNILKIDGKKIDSTAMKLFLAVPVFMVLLYVLAFNNFGAGAIKLHIGGLAMTNIILSIFTLVGFAVYNIASNYKTFTIKEFAMRGVIVVLCIIMLSIVFSPFVVTKYDVDDDGRSREAVVKDSYAYYNIFTINDDYKEILDEFHDANSDEMESIIDIQLQSIISRFTVKEINNGDATIFHQQLANYIVAGDFLNNLRFVNQLMIVFVALFALAVADIMVSQLYALTNNEASTKSNKSYKIIALLAAILILGYSAVFIITGSSVLDTLRARDCTLAIGGAPICMLIFAIILMFVPSKFKRNSVIAKSVVAVANKNVQNKNVNNSTNAVVMDSAEVTAVDEEVTSVNEEVAAVDTANNVVEDVEKNNDIVISNGDIEEVEIGDIDIENIEE